MRYDIYLDFKIIKDTVYSNNIGPLTDSLSKMFGKPRSYFRGRFDQQRDAKNQYYSLVKGLDFDDYDRLRKFPIFNQDGSGSCVAQTEAKELGIMQWLKDGNYVHFSAADIYQHRSNKPDPGMSAIDARTAAQAGVTLEVLAPSQNLSDTLMDSVKIEEYKKQVGSVFSVPNYVEDPKADIDTIASIIQSTGKGVMVWFFFKIDEWTERPSVKYGDLTVETGLRHSVTAVDFCLINGKKCIIIDDSWGTSFGQAGQRIVDEDFFKSRNWYAGHLMSFKFDMVKPQRPIHMFMVDMEFEQTTDEVKALQDCLKFEKVFPSNVDSTGYFGGATLQAVKDFQVKYCIAGPSEPGYGRVGPLTRAKLNELYGHLV